ncbi:Fe(3+)-transporting ATPase [Syntrophobotulus glycolicus DSM 8271]|uniref:Fe(3+)-transporting ATPase n=1 Tax=Syntrophobotulus glycolicus (strain DSM 8271 / FlGlyR) TaxID=645991 RepID=F0SV96_SYNGF|nr:ABC transporter ATP-binding protein [Syntrophobotulus glycolicus]ADY55596.1 Fe(3+)-transporting ATPase [Syntrophobotulus glycolicus DSM 8271]
MELTIQKLTKRYKDKTAVNNVSLTLTPGVWGLLGANGAGKTTLMRMVAGILTPTSGKVQYDGIEIKALGEAYRDVFGYLPQNFGFYPEFTVADYLQYMASLKGLPQKETNQKIDELLHRLTLTDVRNKHIRKLSGGMQRRVGIAQALLNDPDILILDEPTSGLDPGERIRFRNILSEFAQQRIVLISTHIVSDVEYIANRNAIMKDGQIIAVGTTDELVKTMDGKVWQSTIPAEQLHHYERTVRVVTVRNEEGGSVSVRYVSESPSLPDSQNAAPRLEDLYLWLFRGEEAVKEDAV